MTAKIIIVPESPSKEQVKAGLRQFVLMVGPLLTAVGMTGWAGQLNGILAFSGPIATIVVLIWGQLHTRTATIKGAAMAAKLDDSIAQTK